METSNETLAAPMPRVLIVDDTADHRDLQGRLLLGGGYEVTAAVDLRDARKQLDRALPDLVLLDVRLPDGNGIDFCRHLKSNPALDDVVVVLISSLEISAEAKDEGLDAGANDYLVRPMPKREFMARINRQIRLQQMRKCLTEAQVELERRVKERTQQLVAANAELRREIEERRRAEASLRESEDRFRVLAENARDLICLIDPRGRYEYVSPSYATILGFSLAEVRAMNPLDLVHPDDLALAGNWRECPAREFRVRKADGSWVWMEGCSYPVTWHGAAYVVGVMREIAERKRAEELLRALPQQILEAQEAERRRVSRDLHDSVNQLLASVRFRVETLEEVTANARPVVRETLDKAKELLETAMQEVRRISRNLRPGELDDLGLVPALRGAIEEFALRTRLRVDFKTDGLPDRLPASLELHLYRIVQEALSNVERHAAATAVSINLAGGRDGVRLDIQDDGRGLPAARAQAAAAGRKPGIGLLNLRERAAACGGGCELTTEPGTGLAIRVRVPWPVATGPKGANVGTKGAL